jgi:hypothetical protein
MHVFILIIFLNSTGAIDSYTVGGTESLEQCHKTIEADKPTWKAELKGIPFCIDTTKASGLIPVPPKQKAVPVGATEI